LPNNPTGLILNEAEYAQIAQYAEWHGITLIFDHCFRAYSEAISKFDQYSVLERSGCRYAILEDTGKTISALDLKIGMATSSEYLYDPLRALNQNILLNVSPLVLRILSAILSEWRVTSGLKTLNRAISLNRELVQGAYKGSALMRRMHSDEIPVEWLEVRTEQLCDAILASCAAKGLHLLPGASFFGQPNAAGSRFLRIALSRDLKVVEVGSRILKDILATIDKS
jgi:aspartate/methionine/tyrosine aminotransferase